MKYERWHINAAIKNQLYIETDTPALVCDMQLEQCVNSSERTQTQRDARLIAAAPDLLALLKLAEEYMSHPDVKSIPFCIRSGNVAARIGSLVSTIERK